MAKRKGSGKDIGELTVAELRAEASRLEITGRSSMNKAELRQAVEDAEEQLATIKRRATARRKKAAATPPAKKAAAKSAPKKAAAKSTPKKSPAASRSRKSADGMKPASEITAPSIGPHTKIETDDPEERLAKHEQSDVDAMGFDKRRRVAGGKYGPSFAKQAALYGIALAVAVVALIGGKLAVDELDQGPDQPETQAPWSKAADQRPPAPIDFPRNPSP